MAHTTHIKIGDGNAHSGNIIGSFNIYKSDEDAQIMRWLSPLEPNNRHQSVRNERFDGVGDWVLETSEFREWRGSKGGADGAVLFCSGNPGVGKTYISSLVIDSLCDQARKEDIIVAALYCDFLAHQEQTIANMMGAILKQLAGRGDIPDYLREAFYKGKKELGGRGLRLPDLMGMLRITIASLPQVFICIDALDECLPKHLPELLKSLRDIVREFPRTRIFLTGRPHVKEDVQRCFTEAIVIPISPNTDDIRSYLQMRLDGDPDPEAMNDDLRADIIQVILEKISDIFLLVSLNVDAILGEVTIRQRRKKLEEMTKGNGLSDAYTATLTRLKAQKGNRSMLGLKVLMWVSYSERPLRAEELCHALGVEVGSRDLDAENVPALRTLLASCLGLVTVEASSPIVRLVHYTLQEHLSSDPTLFHTPHSTIAEVCLTYLNFECVRDLSPTLHSAPATTPLLEYASCYWGEHTRRGMTEDVKSLALTLLDRFDEHISAQLVLLRYHRYAISGPFFLAVGGPIGFTGLHGAAFFGIVGIVSAILKIKEGDINATDGTGSTALTWAAVRGHEEAVKVLLDREDVNPNRVDTRYGRTPLSWAAWNKHEGVVKTLLERGDVNPNHADTEYGQTPLLLAAGNGHERMVKMLLERGDVNPDQPDTKSGRTPLSWASESGHEGVVKMLLERGDVNPDHADTEYGWTPLLWATESGHEGVVRMFLERGDVNPDQPDTKSGRTPLSWAAEGGHEGIVKILLGQGDIDPNNADTGYGRTPLWWAAGNEHEEVVKMILGQGDVDPNQADTKYGRTPLSLAAGNGHEGMVKVLLERGDVNPNQADTEYGRTPLSLAAGNGCEGVVEMLLERKDVSPDQADTEYGQTPLSWAAEGGYEGVVKMLLERGDVNPNQADTKSGRTPLSLATEGGYEEVVKMLLERGDVNPDQACTKYGWTPLSLAGGNGHEGIVKMLLERGDVNPDHADTRYGRTPLSWAAGNGHEEIVKMFLERVNVNPDHADTKYGWTPLSLAAGNGHQTIVKMLLERGDANPDHADTKYGRTPLSWAAGNGHEGIVKILLGRGDVNPDQADTKSGRTPLSLAAGNGHQRIVKMLLERVDVNPNQACTKYGRTPLSLAAGNGHEGVVKTLLERRDVCTATTDSANQTPLSRALSRGHDRVVRMLLEGDSVDSDTAGRVDRHPSQPLLAMGASAVGMPFGSDNLNIDITGINNRQAHLLADPNGWEPVLGLKDSPSKPADSDLPSTRQSRLPPTQPPKLLAPSQKSRHPTQQHSINSPTRGRPVDRYFAIAFSVCLLAFLVYILPSLPKIIPLHK